MENTIIEGLLLSLKQVVVECNSRSKSSLKEGDKKYWEGAENAYHCVINSLERELEIAKNAQII